SLKVSIYRNTGSSGSFSFSATAVDLTTGSAPQNMAIGDIDGDGKLDIAVANYSSNTVSVFLNTSTSGTISFASSTGSVFTTGTNPKSVAIGDFDGDGKPDLAVANYTDNTISVFKNNGSTGSISFAAKADFSTGSGSNPYSVSVGDIDGDGKPDIAAANYTSNNIAVFLNTSSGSINFAAHSDFTGGTNPSSILIGDIDGDGKSDLAFSNYNSNTVSVLRNTSSIGSISFAAKSDYTAGTAPLGIAIGDIDGDGKPDLAVVNNTDNTVSVLRNISTSGSISFSSKVDFATGSFTNPGMVAIGDIDGDGKPDIACSNSGMFASTASLYRNNPQYIPTISSFSPLSGMVGDAITITGTNFSSTASNNIVFFGATKATVSTATTTSLSVAVPTGAIYAPITVLTTGTALAAYSTANFNPIFSPNKGSISTGDFAAKSDITTGSSPGNILAGDIDGDGKPDLVVINGTNTVSIFRNTGSSGTISFATNVDITTGTLPVALAIGDIDGDGKLDIAVVNKNSYTVSVFRNTSSSSNISFAAKVDLSTGSSTYPQSVAIGDIDGDGKPDIAVADYNAALVSVFLNTGSSGNISFATKSDFTCGNAPYSIRISDIDGDGKPDIAVANYSSNSVSVLRNTGSNGSISFATKVDIATGSNPITLTTGDIDGDGKTDIIVANYYATSISVLRNTSSSGSISFAAKLDLTTSGDPYFLSIGDIDGDGKPDITVSNISANNISVFRNKSSSGSLSFAAKIDFSTGVQPNGIVAADIDGDGKLDISVSNSSSSTVSVLRNTQVNTWTGTTSSAWATAGNWSANVVPAAADNVIIPTGASNMPVQLSGTQPVSNITIQSSASLTVTGVLQIAGTISNSGTFTATAGTIEMNGSSAQTIPTSTFSTNTIKNLTINNTAGVTLGGTLNITGTITPTSGTLTTGGYLTLISTSGTATGSIAQGSSSGGYLSGNTTVQRWIGSSQQWRMIGFPFGSGTSILKSALSGFYTSGYDAYTYNEAADDGAYGNTGAVNAGWVQFTSGSVTSDKGILAIGGNTSTINFSGPVNTGDQTITLGYSSSNTNKGWNLIANPFASNISWTSIIGHNGGMENAVYRYNPNGSYASHVGGIGANGGDAVIENGASFFIHSSGGSSITINESDKVSSAPGTSLFGLQPTITQNKSIIKLSLAKQGETYDDEVVVRWGIDPATDDFDSKYDAYDLGRSFGADLSVIGHDGTVYSIFHGSALQTKDKEQRIINLRIKDLNEGNYSINTSLLSAIYDDNDVYLIDSYTNQTTLISTNAANYPFLVTPDANSASPMRFSLALNYKPKINTGINEVLLLNNPSTNNQITIASGSDYQKIIWQLTDISGRILQSGTFNSVTKGTANHASTQNLLSGNYFIKLIADGKILQTQKWIKQ
ncbi:MAG: T9SS type A sorting domain-containing protein, partial [Bacteroidota bacterium]|nr:T9SS type A sorting domain-containing protein [Bacteroidota bacterium]